jgi:Rps23 Pro-64 3,4-dihydroxylase Tpa1-like proline 4-hydroxylase
MTRLSIDVEGVRRTSVVPRTQHTIGSKKVLVFDDLFSDSFVESFGLVLLRQDYQYRPSFDNELSASMTAELLTSLPVLPEVVAVILQHYYPEMVASPVEQVLSHGYAAAMRFGDSCAVHRDVACPDCVTFLYYGNLTWNPTWGGETIFHDDDMSAAACVSPRPGRLVLFNAALYHRAGVPSRHCPSFRYGLSLFYRCRRMLGRGR